MKLTRNLAPNQVKMAPAGAELSLNAYSMPGESSTPKCSAEPCASTKKKDGCQVVHGRCALEGNKEGTYLREHHDERVSVVNFEPQLCTFAELYVV